MKKTLLLITIFTFCSSLMFSQKMNIINAETSFFEKNKEIGGDVEIKYSTKEANGENTYSTFEINAEASGNYYLDAWICFPKKEGIIPEYKILVNGIEQDATIKSSREGWQSASLTDAKKLRVGIKLQAGSNKISIKGIAPEIPKVDFIKLSSRLDNTGISEVAYNKYYEDIKSSVSRSNSTNKISSGSNTYLNISSGDTTNMVQTRSVGTNGQEFSYTLNVPVRYTTTSYYRLGQGQVLEIQTTSNNYEHVIECFNDVNPSLYSYGVYSTGNGYLRFTVPVTGIYVVRYRAYRQLSSGLINTSVLVNSKVLETMTNAPVSGYGMVVPSQYNASTDVNSFTCQSNSGAYTSVWVQGYNCKIIAYNEFYKGKGDFNWTRHSRINSPTSDATSVLFSAFSSNTPATTCDVYIGLKNCDAATLAIYPNLKADDAIRTAPATSAYNAYAWSVGITNAWVYPLSDFSSAGSPLASFDAFYSKYGFERTSQLSEAAICVWTADNGAFKHASVRKNSISDKANRPHGFDWESKFGAQCRATHTKDQPAGIVNGNIAYYYKPKSTTRSLSLSSASTPLIEEAELSSVEQTAIENIKIQMPFSLVADFEMLYSAWSKTWTLPEVSIYNNPREYAKSQEYNKLLSFCQKYGKATWPLFIEKLNQGDVFNINLLEDLTFSENKYLLDEVKIAAENNARSLNVIPTLNSNAMNYAKKLLNKRQVEMLNEVRAQKFTTESLDINLFSQTSNIVIEIDVQENSNATIDIYDIYGSVVASGMNKPMVSGKNIIDFNVPKSGYYVVNVTVNDHIISKKINVQ